MGRTDQGVMTVGREIRAGRDRKYRPPAPMAGRFWRRCKGEHGLWEGKIALKVRTLEDEVFQIGHVDIGVTSINVPKSFRGVWGGRLSCVSLEIRVIYRRNGFPLGCQTKKLLSKEEERGQITESCELWRSIEGLWHKLLAFFFFFFFNAAGILFHLRIGEQVLKVTCGLRVLE